MKNYILGLAIICSAILYSCAGKVTEEKKAAEMNLKYCDSIEGQAIISQEDKFAKGMNEFDLVSRLSGTGLEPTQASYLQFAASNITDWSDSAKAAIDKSADRITERINALGLKLPFPDTIKIVTTNMKEEGEAAGYTRGTTIYLCDYYCARANEKQLDNLLSHELFHILTRNSPEFREATYKAIGFNIMDKEIEFGQDILAARISNPDVNNYDNWAEFTINGEKQKCTIIFYTDKEYTTGPFYLYGKTGLVPLDDKFNPITKEDGTTVIYPIEAATDFYDVVGKNTEYTINAEEILADNFSLALNAENTDGSFDKLPTPEIAKKLIEACKNWQ